MSRKQVYTTNLLIVSGFALIGFWKSYEACYVISAVVAIGTLINFTLAKHISGAWIFVGKILGGINAKILLTVFYFLFLFPIAMLKRLLSRPSPIPDESNWKIRTKEQVNFKNPF